MNEKFPRRGILMVSHGSPRAETNAKFVALAQRIAARLGTADLLPTFFSIARPDIPDQVGELVSRGVRHVVFFPYFLGSGQHVTHDIPALLGRCREQFSGVELELLSTLEGEPAMEDLVVERLAGLVDSPAPLPTAGAAIQERSHAIIDRHLAGWEGDVATRAIVRRVVHATADFSFARSIRIHPEAIERGRAALAAGCAIVCDVRMVQAGITRVENEVLTAIDLDAAQSRAQATGCTRAAAAMELLAERIQGGIVAIGNAPTALFKVLEMAQYGVAPALVVGLPVGLVGARESKAALMESDLAYITNVGPRGGSPVAAAAINALAELAHSRGQEGTGR